MKSRKVLRLINVGGDDLGSPLSYKAPYSRGGRTIPGLAAAPAGEYLTDRLTAEAETFIDAHRDRAFFLQLAHYAVHIPIVAKDEIVGKYPGWDGFPHGRQENPFYAAMIESLDESVGRILKKLDETGLTGKTYVVFTSDNGGLATLEGPHTPPTINAPLREGKGWLYEGGIRVPLIVRRPGHVPSAVEATPVWTADLFPTLRDLCGLKTSGEVDGVSLANLIRSRTPLPARGLFWHFPHYSNQGGRPGGALRDGDWKLVEDFATGRKELFDLSHDAGESNNLAEARPEKLRELAAKLAAWRASLDVAMTTPNHDYNPNPQDSEGLIRLPASTAEVHGIMLRYEPLPHKNTLGYWVRADDWASWDFEVTQPGTFAVEALVGCGNGSGGSTVEFRVAGQTLSFQVPVTGGFQNFREQDLGRITFARPGRYRLVVQAIKKPGPAVMDLRQMRLTPVGTNRDIRRP